MSVEEAKSRLREFTQRLSNTRVQIHECGLEAQNLGSGIREEFKGSSRSIDNETATIISAVSKTLEDVEREINVAIQICNEVDRSI